jgi:UDP-N-acetylenolpyruvoylglucosamine reductase
MMWCDRCGWRDVECNGCKVARWQANAIAAATGTAKTAKQAECEASQSGAEGNRPKAAA